MAHGLRKTEHAGGKNGGDHRRYRIEAKTGSKKKRRANDQRAIQEEWSAPARRRRGPA